MPTMTIKNVSGKNSYFGYGDPSFYLVNGASQASLPYSLAANYQFQRDLEAGRIEVTAGSPLITLRNLTAVHAYFGYLPPTFPLAAAAEGPLMCQMSEVPGVRGLADELADTISPLAKDIVAGRTATDGVIITLSAVTNGTINPAAGAHAINTGADYSIAMTPSTGYHVSSVLDNTVSKPLTSPYVIHSAVIDHTVAIAFAINTYAVTFGLDGGTRTGGGALSQTINYNASATPPTYTAPAGYRIADVPWTPVLAAITAITTYTALYTKTWQVNATAGTHGSIDVPGQVIDDGLDAADITATADEHYHFTAWSGSYTGSANPYKFLAVTANKAISAIFAIDTFVLTYTAGANGSIVGTSPQTVDYNTSGTEVVATPAAHYHFAEWSDDPGGLGIPAARTDINVMNTITVAASFAIDTYAVTFDLGTGTRTGGGALVQTIDWNTSATAPTYTAAAGYRIADVPWDAPLTNITAIQTITAAYTKTWVLTYSAGANGSIVGTTPQTVDDTTSGAEVVATPAAHYHFDAWSDAYPTAARTDLAVAADITASASFAIDTYTLTYSAGAGGSVVGTTPQTVNWNASGSEVVATPDAGYRFRQWSDAVMTAARTDAAVSANITVSASFIEIWTLTMAKGTGTGDITPVAGTSTVDDGVETAITATALNFVNWTVTGGATVADANAASTTATLTADGSVTANWSA